MTLSIEFGSNGFGDFSEISGIIISLFALITAICSIVLTIKYSNSQEKYNKLSVSPLPYVIVGDYVNRIYVKIKNNGTGPLIIKSVEIKNDKKIEKSLIAIMPSPPENIFWTNYAEQFDDRSVRPGDEVCLLEIVGDSEDNEKFAQFRDEIRFILSRAEVIVNYTDIYKDDSWTYTRILDWFVRKNR